MASIGGEDATGLLPVALLPVSALRLAVRFFVPLALWFSAGSVVRFLLIQAISHLGHGSHLGIRQTVVLVPLSIMVLASLVVTIGMMFTLGRGLSVIADPEEAYGATVARTLFPFVLTYLAWNLYIVDLREVLRADAQRLVDQGDTMNAGYLFQLPIAACLAVAIVAWIVRLFCERRYDQTPNRLLAVLTAFFEVTFTLYALYSIVQLIRSGQRWLTGRTAWHSVADAVHLPSLPIGDALVLPLVWFAIAAIVYGLEMRDRELISGTRLERIPERFGERPRHLAEVAGRSMREKYVPVLHAARLVLRAGAPVAAWFCLCYVAVGALTDRLQRGALWLLGTDHTVRFWNLALAPAEFGHRLLQEILRLALLAAMFELVMRRTSARTPAPDRPEPVKDPHVDAA
jgi:hypothetical protein